MKKTLKIFTTFFILMLLFASTFAQSIPARPKPQKLVNDFANILSSSEEQRLERKLVAYNDSTSTQITVITISKLNGQDPNLFAAQIGEKWGVGQKGRDNGMIILIAPNDRKVAIQVGYGLEEYVPDAYAKQIVDEIMIPQFKSGKWFAGIEKASYAIYGLLSGKFNAFDGASGSIPWSLIIVLLVVIVVLVIAMARGSEMAQTISDEGVDNYPDNNPKRKRRAYRPRRQWGGRGRSQWGGGTWGGGFGGGSSGGSGGGFGGFGGGSFGGGGASGSW